MIPVYKAEIVQEMDAEFIQAFGMPSHTLMEIAAKGIADISHKPFPRGEIHVSGGPGNKGGDGLACARGLAIWGRKVSIDIPINPTSTDASINYDLCLKLGLIPLSKPPITAQIYIDALLGAVKINPKA